MVSISRRKRSTVPSASLRRHEGQQPPNGGTHPQAGELEPIRRRRDQPSLRAEKPDAGRTTRLGRKVESPASIKTAGPSGQRGSTQHQKQHTNK